MIHKVRVRSFSSFLSKIHAFTKNSDSNFFVFRGHRDPTWRLQSTFARFSASKLPEYNPLAIEYLISRFIHGLATIGDRAMIDLGRREQLELARHYGIPSPLIDVSYSPYVALWFALNGMRASSDRGDAVLYTINYNNLAVAYSCLLKDSHFEKRIMDTYGKHIIDFFRWEVPNLFDTEFPQNILKFLPSASSRNTRVQRQHGCFLYDTLLYAQLGVFDLEEFIERHEAAVQVSKSEPILTKFFIPYQIAREAFEYLDLMGIRGAMLMGDYTGVVSDVLNTFNYNPRYRAWDLRKRSND